MAAQAKSPSLFDPAILGPAVGGAFRKLDPRTLWRNPVMFAVEIVSAATTILFVRDLFAGSGARIFGSDQPMAVVHGAVRELRRGRCRRTRQGASGEPAPHPIAGRREAARSGGWRTVAGGPGGATQGRRCRHRRRGRPDPERRRGHRGHRVGRRVGDHRRIRTGHPRKRRRPLGGDRRHPRSFRSDQGADHREPGIDLSRPHDQTRRRRGAAEDAERDRAKEPLARRCYIDG